MTEEKVVYYLSGIVLGTIVTGTWLTGIVAGVGTVAVLDLIVAYLLPE